MKIRLMSVADIADVVRIRTSVRENHMSVEELEALGITPQSIADMIEASACGWVAEIEGCIVGFSMANRQEGEVFALFVDPDEEGHGIGRALLSEAETFLFQFHDQIVLTTAAGSRAETFYCRCGYDKIARDDAGDISFIKKKS